MIPEVESPSRFPALPPGFLSVVGPGRLRWILRENTSPPADKSLWDTWIRGDGGRVLDDPGGRAPVYLIELEGTGPLVLRRYRHGGLLGPFLGDHFLGVERFLAELQTSEMLRREGVLTPEVVALHFRGIGGPLFRGWILTRHIPGGRNLRQWAGADLPGDSERRKVLRLAARAVASLHAAGCFHRDLNLSNLFLASGNVFVLDLDGARVERALGMRSRCDNLLRLYRSLAKETRRVEPLSLRDRWIFLRAYAEGEPGRCRALWRILSSRWALAGARHSLARLLRHLIRGSGPQAPAARDRP